MKSYGNLIKKPGGLDLYRVLYMDPNTPGGLDRPGFRSQVPTLGV